MNRAIAKYLDRGVTLCTALKEEFSFLEGVGVGLENSGTGVVFGSIYSLYQAAVSAFLFFLILMT